MFVVFDKVKFTDILQTRTKTIDISDYLKYVFTFFWMYFIPIISWRIKKTSIVVQGKCKYTVVESFHSLKHAGVFIVKHAGLK